ncbi:MAG TPA: hypothetical protein VKG26_07295 [Bacteroidia bacterium]|nr:hypothetical protein [Bacteroidia bacterium]
MRLLLLTLTILLTSCFKVDDFTNDELIWYKPFTKTHSVIFISEKGDRDTIIFKAPEHGSESKRDFEQGFYNANFLSVNYDFTKGSYHQFAMMSDGKTRYDQDFVSIYKSSAGYSDLEIGFIGTLFNANIKNVQQVNDTIYFFDSNKADYVGMNVQKGINSFTFNTRLGVVEFVDDKNIKWTRK